jgi:hypothetical protein
MGQCTDFECSYYDVRINFIIIKQRITKSCIGYETYRVFTRPHMGSNFLCSLVKLLTATVSFIVSVRPSVHPSAQNSFPAGQIFKNFQPGEVLLRCHENLGLVNIWQTQQALYIKPVYIMTIFITTINTVNLVAGTTNVVVAGLLQLLTLLLIFWLPFLPYIQKL